MHMLTFLQGTLPFMPLRALVMDSGFQHTPADDLEGLFHTAMAVFFFTSGPCGKWRDSKDAIPVARWFNELDRRQIRGDKASDLLMFPEEMKDFISGYWKPFFPFIMDLIKITWPDKNPAQPSDATYEGYKGILQNALALAKSLNESLHPYASERPKRPRTLSQSIGDRRPYKYWRSAGGLYQRRPRPAHIRDLSEWQESIDE